MSPLGRESLSDTHKHIRILFLIIFIENFFYILRKSVMILHRQNLEKPATNVTCYLLWQNKYVVFSQTFYVLIYVLFRINYMLMAFINSFDRK